MKRIVIVTTRFPYFYTEAFLETEFPYLQTAFDRITFLPLYKGKKRESCADASVNDDYSLLYENKYVVSLKVLATLSFYKNLWKHKSKIFQKKRIANTFKQQVHYQILKKVVLNNEHLFGEDTIVYSYWFNAPVYAFLRIREELGLSYKVVCRAHRFDVYDENGEMPNRTFCLRHIDKVFPISQDAINVLSKKYGYKEKFELSRLGVKDNGTIASASQVGNFHILSVSQVHPRKRIREIYNAVQTLAKERIDTKFTWTHFGNGSQDAELQEWANSVEGNNLLIEVKGRVPNTEIMSYIGDTPVDVFINLSSSEGVPVSVMEAQSFGLPVVATNVGGTAEVMNGNNGILLSASPSNEEVVNALKAIMDSSYDRKEIKAMWNKISNGAMNFPKFISSLQNILE